MVSLITVGMMSVGLVSGVSFAVAVGRSIGHIPHSDSFWHDINAENMTAAHK